MTEPPPLPPPASTPPASAAPPSGHAVASLVLGILGFLMLPLVGAILAIVFARMAEREIAASGGTIGGKGLADAGRILGIIGVVLAVIVIVLVVLAFVILDAEVLRIERIEVPRIQFTVRPG